MNNNACCSINYEKNMQDKKGKRDSYLLYDSIHVKYPEYVNL